MDLEKIVAALSGPSNRVIYDDLGRPSVMVEIPCFNSSDVDPSLPHHPHPAFILNGQVQEQVWVSKYQNIVSEGRAYSLPLQDPAVRISHDQALAACRAKGEGWGLVPASLWSALALWCRKHRCEPRGNNRQGHDCDYVHETGLPTYWEQDKPCRLATGSGPAAWYHDGTPDGIADLYGNISEWNCGMRLVRGEINIIPQAQVMAADADVSPESPLWRAILPDGSLTAPGSADTLKLDFAQGHWQISTHVLDAVDDARGALFRDTTYDPAELPQGVPALLKELTLYPASEDRLSYRQDVLFANNYQEERTCLRGGNWTSAAFAGMFYSAMDAKRNRIVSRLGFRSAYYGAVK